MSESVILVFASRDDDSAPRLVERLGSERSLVVTGVDVAGSGWRHVPGDLSRAAGRAGNTTFSGADVSGAVILLPAFAPCDVPHVIPEERMYVAAEITAFTLAWISQLSCPMLNRPTAACLSGPAWPPEQWAITAARLGIPTWPLRRSVGLDGPTSGPARPTTSAAVTAVADRFVGDPDSSLRCYTRALGSAAGVDLLTAYFAPRNGEHVLVGISVPASLAAPESLDAIADYFDSAAGKR